MTCQVTHPLPVLYIAYCSLGTLSYYPVPLLRAMLSSELPALVSHLFASTTAYMHIQRSDQRYDFNNIDSCSFHDNTRTEFGNDTHIGHRTITDA